MMRLLLRSPDDTMHIKDLPIRTPAIVTEWPVTEYIGSIVVKTSDGVLVSMMSGAKWDPFRGRWSRFTASTFGGLRFGHPFTPDPQALLSRAQNVEAPLPIRCRVRLLKPGMTLEVLEV